MMPPPKKPQPAPEQKLQIADWIKSAVFKIDPQNPDPGRVTVRLLNRARASRGGDVPLQSSLERGADVEHPRWPEMRQLLIRHVRGLRFPASDHRLHETITLTQRAKHNAAMCTNTTYLRAPNTCT